MGGLVDGNYPAELPYGWKPRPLRPRSIRNIVGVVMGGVLAYAVEHDWITENPLAKVTLPKIVRSDDDMVFLMVDEVELLADEAARIGTPADGLLVR